MDSAYESRLGGSIIRRRIITGREPLDDGGENGRGGSANEFEKDRMARLMGVGLVVNVYERTYRDVLTPGFFPRIVEQNEFAFDQVVALINNVDDPADARGLAEGLVVRGEITSHAFVSEHIGRALEVAKLPPRVLRTRPYLLDYGLVMPHVVDTTWLLGWDAETRLVRPANWVTPAVALLEANPNIFHASLAWTPAAHLSEEVARLDRWSMNWGFSDQLFLVRAADLRGPIYQHWTAAAYARHSPHPYTFEYRVESYQRWSGRMRATLADTSYLTNNIPGGVLSRTGGRAFDQLRIRFLHRAESSILNRLPAAVGPRWTKRGDAPRRPGSGESFSGAGESDRSQLDEVR